MSKRQRHSTGETSQQMPQQTPAYEPVVSYPHEIDGIGVIIPRSEPLAEQGQDADTETVPDLP